MGLLDRGLDSGRLYDINELAVVYRLHISAALETLRFATSTYTTCDIGGPSRNRSLHRPHSRTDQFCLIVTRHGTKEFAVRLNGLTLKNAKAVRLYHDDPSSASTLADTERVLPLELEVNPACEIELFPHSDTSLVGKLG